MATTSLLTILMLIPLMALFLVGMGVRTFGLQLLAAGLLCLGYTAASLLAIYLNDGAVPSAINFYWLFAIAPVGLVLTIAGGLIVRIEYFLRKRQALNSSSPEP